MKHDMAAVASHKTKQYDKFSFSTMSAMVCDDPFVMSVTVCGERGSGGGGGPTVLPLYTSTLLLDHVSQKL